MSERKLHRGHTALLGVVQAGDTCTATLKNGTVGFDHHSQDFLVGWYEDLKGWDLIQTEDWLVVGKFQTCPLPTGWVSTASSAKRSA